MTWIEDYLVAEHGRSSANLVLDDIDRRQVLINLIGNLLTIEEALRSFRHLPGYVDFPRAGALNSGRVTTQKL